ncbi:myosin-11-like [Boleophthalmus pectinirostris]|uniref:myosin-11-like n=1 Tax=Boleophthalmus pectinirostris TaxID=150288 RepID=UPI00242C1DE9|nr:myosin-11-like [Boleophthalmus pectinirostris]
MEVSSEKLRILMDKKKQEEEHHETRSARALQENHLNLLLCKQQEIEAKNKQNMMKLRQQNSTLQQQIVSLTEYVEHLQGTGTLKEKQLQEENKQLSRELHAQKELVNKHETTEELLAQVHRENQSLRQQLEELHRQRDAEQKNMVHTQQHCADMMSKLHADCDQKVQLVEERNKELLLSQVQDLQDQVCTLEKKLERDGNLRLLQQDLSQTLKELSEKERSLELKTQQCTDLENEKTRVLRKVDRLKDMLVKMEDQRVKMERRCKSLESSFEEKEKECAAATQRLQETLSTSAASAATIKDLKEAVQTLQIQNVQLKKEKPQSFKTETLERDAHEAEKVRAHLQEQRRVSPTAQEQQALGEQEVKSSSRSGLQESELEKQKAAVDARLEQEMSKTSELQTEVCRLRTLVKKAKKKIQHNDRRGEKMKDLEVQLDRETQRHQQLKKDNSDLHEKLTSLEHSLQKSQRTEEEVQDLRRRMEEAQRERAGWSRREPRTR